MKPMFGLAILIGCLIIGIYVTADYLLPDVICKSLSHYNVDSSMGQYNSHVLSDICFGISR